MDGYIVIIIIIYIKPFMINNNTYYTLPTGASTTFFSVLYELVVIFSNIIEFKVY